MISTHKIPAQTPRPGRTGGARARKGLDINFLNTRWYLSRLASMGPAEIVWRTRSAARLPLDWAQWKRKASAPRPRWQPLHAGSYPVHLHHSGMQMETIRVFDLEFPVGFDFDWHRDYRYQRQVERSFATTLNIRDTRVVSDIKYVWEPSRHQYLSALAFAENAGEHAPYIVRSLDSWILANPYLYGVHWTSSLEMAERIISWALLYPRISGQVNQDEAFRRRWLESIYLHLARIARKLSLYSSANNHLIGELVGLFVGATCFDFWPECSGWRKSAAKLLEREIRLQIGQDGVDREQAISYHLFAMELFLLAFAVGRNSQRPFSEGYEQRLRSMAAFLDAIATPSGDLPCYGDSDDARGFVVSEGESALEVTTQLAGLLFAEPRWLRFRSTPTEAAHALVPDLISHLNPSPAEAEPRDSRPELFHDAGLACLRTHDGRVRLVMDFGPLGFTSTAAHGHADALAIWMAIDDQYFVVDAGTYAYHSHPEWREFFRGTSAHNTARVDGQNQSEMAGRFLWSAKANSRLLGFEKTADQVTIQADHDGYKRLPDPVIHRRTVGFDLASGNTSIEDYFECAGRHEIELFFHMHEDAAIVSVGEGEAHVEWGGRRIVFSSSAGDHARWEVFRGSENPRLGWRSRQFNQKHPIATLRARMEIDGPTAIRTNLRVQS